MVVTSVVNIAKVGMEYTGVFLSNVKNQFGKQEVGAYVVWGSLMSLAFFLFSDGDFSFTLTLSAAFQMLSFALLALKVWSQKSTVGISEKSLIIYVAVYVFRLSNILFFEGYLPADRTGNHVYPILEVISLCINVGLLFACKSWSGRDHQEKFPVGLTLFGCICLAAVVHPDHNWNFFLDSAWAASVYLDTLVVFPQLMLMQSGDSSESVDMLSSHSIACTFISRVSNLAFWWTVRNEFIDEEVKDPSTIPGHFIIGALALQVIFLCDFMYCYVKAHMNKLPMTFSDCFCV